MVASMASMTVSAAGDTTATEAPASGTGSSTGAVEGYVDKKVFSVTFPTTPAVDFTMDPQGLIEETGSQKGTQITLTNSGDTVLFGNDTDADGATDAYSNTSDKITITSLSSMALDVTVNATIDNAAGLTFDDSSFTNKGHLYLALKDTAGNTETITADGATLKGSIAALEVTNFETTWDGSAYVYGLASSISDPSTVAKTYEFQLTGSANPDVDWSELTTAAPKVNLVWNIAEHVDPYIPAGESMSVAGGDMAVTLDSAAMGDNNATVTSISASVGGRTRELLGNATYCTASGDTYTFTSSVPANTVITFKFSDGRTETITVGA
jgi:hypothetical protein